MSRQLKRIGKLSFYKDERIGFGNFSSVFKGKFEDIKDVAVKRLLQDKSRVNAMLLTEASDHPNIVQYVCTETINTDFIYLATELCAGNLEDYVLGRYKGPKLGQTSKEICSQITKGLEHLHLSNIVHGNLKPTNILISFAKGALTPQMKLSDFATYHIVDAGLSLLVSEKTKSRAASTAGWRPIDAAMDFPFDIFTLACVIYYVLTKGHHPFGDTQKARVSGIENNRINFNPQQLVADVVEDAVRVFNMLQAMLNVESKLRPTATQVLAHPFFKNSTPDDQSWEFEAICAAKRIKLEQPESSAMQPQSPVEHAEAPSVVSSTRQTGLNEIKLLGHAYKCEVSNCPEIKCSIIKGLLQHMRFCKQPLHNFNSNCNKCGYIMALSKKHAIACKILDCRYPFCERIKRALTSTSSGSNNTDSVAVPSFSRSHCSLNTGVTSPEAPLQSQELTTSSQLSVEMQSDNTATEGPRTGNESKWQDFLTPENNVDILGSSIEETAGGLQPVFVSVDTPVKKRPIKAGPSSPRSSSSSRSVKDYSRRRSSKGSNDDSSHTADFDPLDVGLSTAKRSRKATTSSSSAASGKGKRLGTANKDSVTGASLPSLEPPRCNLHENAQFGTGFNNEDLSSSGLRRSTRIKKKKTFH